ADLPANTLVFGLLDAPPGAFIDPASGVFSWKPDVDQGPGKYVLIVRVTDNGSPSLFDEQTITISVLDPVNNPPLASISGPVSGVRGQTLEFLISASDADPGDTASGFRYEVNWGDGTSPEAIGPAPGNASGVPLSHAYLASGVFTVSVTATDQ